MADHGRAIYIVRQGIPDAECEIEPGFLAQFRIPYLYFRSAGNPLVGLGLTGASQLRQMLTHVGEIERENEIDRHIAKAKRMV
jgi:hypothetical protein